MAKEPTRTLRITIQDTDEGHATRDYHVSIINNFLKLPSDQKTLFYIFQKGIAAALEEIGKLDSKEAKLGAAIQKKLLELQRREGQWASLNKLYDSMSPEDFQSWCENEGVDMEAFLEWRIKKANNTWRERARTWMAEILRDGNPIQTLAIKEMAINAGIIDIETQDQQWKYMCVLAHREGYTGQAYGCWQKSRATGDPVF